MWGEHGLTNKGFPYIESGVKVPAADAVRARHGARATDSRLAANIDLVPTALEAAGISPSPAIRRTRRRVADPDATRPQTANSGHRVPAAGADWAATRTVDYHYIETYCGGRQDDPVPRVLRPRQRPVRAERTCYGGDGRAVSTGDDLCDSGSHGAPHLHDQLLRGPALPGDRMSARAGRRNGRHTAAAGAYDRRPAHGSRSAAGWR